MALETKISATIELDINKKSFWDWINYARDTGKKIDQELKKKLELDVAWFQLQLDSARKSLAIAKKTMDEDWKIKAQLDVNELTKNTTEAKRQLSNLVNTGDKDLSRLQAKFNQVTDAIKNWGNAFATFTKNFAQLWISVWLTKVTNWVIWLASGLEQAKVSFEKMLWSAKDADVFLKDLANFAKETPFELVGVREQAKLLKAYWFETSKIIPTLELLGNASLGNSEKMWRLVYALGQVRAKTVLAGDDLKQFTETGIPLVAKLAEVTWYSAKQITSDTKSLWITYEQVYQALEKYSGGLGNVLEAQSKTFAGSMSNLKDSLNILGEQVGSIIITALSPLVRILSEFLGKIVAIGEKFPIVTQITGIFLWAITLLSVGLTAIWFLLPWLVSWLGLFGISVTAWTIAVWWLTIAIWTLILPITAVIATVALLATAWTKNWWNIQEKTKAVFTVLKAIFKEIEIAIGNLVTSIKNNFWIIEKALNILTGWFYGLLKGVIKTTLGITDNVNSMEKNTVSTFGKMKVGVSNITQALFWWLYSLFQSGFVLLNNLTNWYVGRIMNTIGAVLSLLGKSYKASLWTNIWLSSAKSVLTNIPNITVGWGGGWGGGWSSWGNSSGWWGWKGKAEDTAKEKADKLLQIEEDRLTREAELNIEAINKSTKWEYEKAKTIKKINDNLERDISNLKKGQADKEADIAEATIKKYEAIEKSGKEAFEWISSEIEKSIDVVKKLNDEIDWINDKLKDVTNSIWKRVIDIENEIKSIAEKQGSSDIDPKEALKLAQDKLKLEQELALAKWSITAEELQKTRDEEAKSITQKLLDQRSQLEQEKKDLQDKVDFEKDLQEKLTQEKIDLDKFYTEQFKIQLKDQELSLKQSVANQVAMYRELALAKSNADAVWASPFVWNTQGWWAVTNNKTSSSSVVVNQYIQASINNWMDIDQLAEQLARKQKLAMKGVE